MDDIYKNNEEFNPNKKRNILIIFDYMIADMLSNKKIDPIVTELFKIKNFNFSCFYYAILFRCSKNIRLNSTHCFFMKILIKRELQQITFNHSSDTDFQDFMNL